MKFDAIDKYNLNNKKKEKYSVIILYVILLIILAFFIFLIYLNSLKGEKFKIYISGISADNKEDFINLIENKSCLQIILPNFKKKLENIYYIEKIKIQYKPFNKIYLKITEKKPYLIIYDRSRGIFYQITKEFYILKLVFDLSLLQLNIVSIDLSKVYKKGEKINISSNKIDLYNEDYLLSEIIVDKGNFFGIPVNNSFIISFGTFINRIKIDNLNLLFSLINVKKNEEKFKKIRYIDISYPEVARIITE